MDGVLGTCAGAAFNWFVVLWSTLVAKRGIPFSLLGYPSSYIYSTAILYSNVVLLYSMHLSSCKFYCTAHVLYISYDKNVNQL